MAFMRMMGRDSVAYHQATVLGRADDHEGQSLEYYGTRGETPLVWGGAGARRLGLDGRVTEYTYASIFGEGGATDPLTGDRLVRTARPGMELVVSPHKSVAVLGAIGRADDMHAIVDAETTATLEFLDRWFQERGGRRGRDQVRTTTAGLTWAVTRHGTSRAGDPAVHDHVLVANIVEMRDAKGGWKGLDTASLRDVLHAATVVGRTAAARRAVELGYGIVPDDGRSGRLRSWRIAGIPDAVCELFSKRSAEIDDFVDDRDSYRARGIAARTTRAAKGHESPDLLAIRWQTELADIGWGPERLRRSIDEAGIVRAGLDRPTVRYAGSTVDAIAGRVADAVLGPESRLGGAKVLSRRDLIVEVGPHLYGHPAALLDAVVSRILDSPAVVPMVAVTAAREQIYAPTHALAVEHAIAHSIDRLAASAARPVDPRQVEQAIASQEAELGSRLTPGQRAAVKAICGDRGRVQFVVGVAGAGKTTALEAATTALEADGRHVIGTATSGQAARTLGTEAAIEARTVASLLWHLDHGHLRLGRNTIVVLDEAAMTTDDDLLRLVTAIEVTDARLVLVGDPRQLGAVGPGGAMAALMDRHRPLVTHMPDNVRQDDPAERAAIARLRAGNLDQALRWYAANDRIHAVPTRTDAIAATVHAWNRDLEAGKTTTMLAWRRDDVAALNRHARAVAVAAGRVRGAAIQAGGLEIATGDQLVALAPNHRAGIVTSQRLTVTGVDPKARTFTVDTDGQTMTLSGDRLGPDQLAYGYATTVHRAQGATFDTCHVYADGGTHQLAYVAVTRARETTTIHCVAETMGQAAEDLRSDWSRPDTQRWIIDDGPDARHADRTPRRATDDLQRARLAAQRAALLDLPAGLFDSAGWADLSLRHASLHGDQTDLRSGTGRWADTTPGRAARRYNAAVTSRDDAALRADNPTLSRRERRIARHEADQLANAVDAATEAWHRHTGPVDNQLTAAIADSAAELAAQPDPGEQLQRARIVERRIHHLEHELGIERAPRLDGPSLGLGL